MSEFDAQRVAERIDIVLDILVAGDYHSAIHNLEILKAELLRQVAESTPDIPKATRHIKQSCLQEILLHDPTQLTKIIITKITI